MFGKRLSLFKLFGIDIGIDLSWTFLFLLITWSLARGLFPFTYEGLPRGVYWWMGIAGASGLFLSLLFHELCHAVVARRYDIPVRGITLFVFGGVAEMAGEPKRPKSEFLMAIVGPISSVLLGAVFLVLELLGSSLAWPIPLRGVLGYLTWINFMVAVFNMLPAFPLDGGRVLRAALWSYKGDLRWATRIAASVGSGFAFLLMLLGFIRVFYGDFVGGIWYFIIGLFLHQASQASYQAVIVRETLAGVPVRRFMRPGTVTVPAGVTLAEALEEYFYKYDHKLFPVLDGDRLVGCLTPKRMREIPREEWNTRQAAEVAAACLEGSTISPDADVSEALTQMDRARTTRLMVVDGDRLLGIITLKDLLHYLSVRMELEGESKLPLGLKASQPA